MSRCSNGVVNSIKPWHSFEQQLSVLKGRGLQVDDDAAALRCLERVGYYRLSGYWYPMRKQQDGVTRLDGFMEGSRFEEAFRLYTFDAKLRLLALDALERIELALRVDVAYLLGKYDPSAHKLPQYLHGNFARRTIKRPSKHAGKTAHAVWLETYQRQLERSKREPFVEHHQQHYGGELPIWVAIEVWDFGMLSKMYSGMRNKDQEQIAKKYGVATAREMTSRLRAFNFIRNVSAHHSRLWNVNVLERASLPREPGYWDQLNHQRPFLYFCFMQEMLRTLCPNSNWSQRFAELLREFPSENQLKLADFGVVEGWEQWEVWKQK